MPITTTTEGHDLDNNNNYTHSHSLVTRRPIHNNGTPVLKLLVSTRRHQLHAPPHPPSTELLRISASCSPNTPANNTTVSRSNRPARRLPRRRWWNHRLRSHWFNSFSRRRLLRRSPGSYLPSPGYRKFQRLTIVFSVRTRWSSNP